jgi:hypothetical protein
LYLGIPIPKKTAAIDSKSSAGSRPAARAVAGGAAGARSGAGGRVARAVSRSLSSQNSNMQHGKNGKHTGQTRCPKCGNGMLKRVVRQGSHAGKTFYGCSTYPVCDGTT